MKKFWVHFFGMVGLVCPLVVVACANEQEQKIDLKQEVEKLKSITSTQLSGDDFIKIEALSGTVLSNGSILGIVYEFPTHVRASFEKIKGSTIVRYCLEDFVTNEQQNFEVDFKHSTLDEMQFNKTKTYLEKFINSSHVRLAFKLVNVENLLFDDAKEMLGLGDSKVPTNAKIVVNKKANSYNVVYSVELPLFKDEVVTTFTSYPTGLSFAVLASQISKIRISPNYGLTFRNLEFSKVDWDDKKVKHEYGVTFPFSELPSDILALQISKKSFSDVIYFEMIDKDNNFATLPTLI